MADVPLGEPLSWDHIYLLGWYEGGRPYLSSWSGNLTRFEGVVTNTKPPHGPPLWDAPVGDAKVYALPHELSGSDLVERCLFAQRHGGVYVIGWLVKDPIDRTPKKG